MILFNLNNKKVTVIKNEDESKVRLLYKALNGEIDGINDYRELMEDEDYFDIYTQEFISKFNEKFGEDPDLKLEVISKDYINRELNLKQGKDKINIKI